METTKHNETIKTQRKQEKHNKTQGKSDITQWKHNKSRGNNKTQVKRRLQACLKDIETWMTQNCLLLNSDKTEVVIVVV